MGQCFGRCCLSNRVRPKHSDSTIILTTQGWIQSDSDDHGIKDETGDQSNNSISESLTLDDKWQIKYNNASTAVENVKPSESPCDEFDGELEQASRKGMNQDQNDQAQSDHAYDHENEVRSMIDAPNDFDNFIRQVIVPKFEQQRDYYHQQNQFAVLLLVTDEDLRDISQMKFHPHDPPITNNLNLSMPDNEKEYRNYIVARPCNDNHHAEKEIFDHLDQLWNGFMRHNDHGVPPKCFILYSWNFPCSKCTQLIIDSFNKPRYKSVSVIVAATAFWGEEEHEIRHQNEAKMKRELFHTSYHRGIILPNHSTNTDSYSDDSSEREYYNDMIWY
jgi:hypothetical protein